MSARGCTSLLASIGVAYGAALACGDATGDVFVRVTAPTRCVVDADCGVGTPRCELGAGRCVACLESSDCAAGQLCVLPSNVCVTSCIGGSFCGDETPVCDISSGTCRACETDRDCGGTAPRCAASGACVECRDAADCADVEDEDSRLCDEGGRCVECLNDGHCDDVEETCSRFLGKCAQPCSAAVSCGSDDPVCDLAIGYCVECRSDDDCDDDQLCRSSECVD